MARIRTIKPEFWDSPSVKGSSPWARLLFIAMWNWADDHGRGTANLKELEGFAFPNDYEFWDRSGNTVHFRDLVAEVSARFGVLFYTVDNRPYYEIPSWDSHQRNERRSKASKYPSPQVSSPVAETPYIDAEIHGNTVTGTGEQGNRGTVLNTLAHSQANERVTGSRFEEFWETYPRKAGKQKAETKYITQAKKHGEQKILDGVHRFANDPNLPTDKTFIPHATTWLERGSWDDEPLPARNDSGQSQAAKNLAEVRSWSTAPEPDWLQIEGNQ